MLDLGAVAALAAVEAIGKENPGGDAGVPVGLPAEALGHGSGGLGNHVQEAKGLPAGVGAAEERDPDDPGAGGNRRGDPP
jgi:hypothetical protein